MKKLSFYLLFLFLLIFTSFVLLETSLRIYLTLKHFKNPHVSYWGKTWYSYENNNIVINKFDENLRSNLKEVNFHKLNLPRWSTNANITINKSGFRENDNRNIIFKNDKKILVTGDSFTYGYQVSNNETWPSYLEDIIKIKVNNGGHQGYSAGQSLKRAQMLSKKEKYDYFIWSVIYNDFKRDVPIKFIIKKNNELQFNKFRLNPEYTNKLKPKNLYDSLRELFFSFYLLDREVIQNINFLKTPYIEKYIPLIDGSNQYSAKEQIEFLIKEFLKIEIKNKYILIQHTDISENTNKKLIYDRKRAYDEKYKKFLFDTAKKNEIKIIDTENWFNQMSSEEKRLMWHDHHTPRGNYEVAKFISQNINF